MDKQKLLIVTPAESKSARLRKMKEKLHQGKMPEVELEKLLNKQEAKSDNEDDESESESSDEKETE